MNTLQTVVGLLTAVGVLLTGLGTLRNGRLANTHAAKTAEGISEVHELVNAQLTDSVERRDAAEARTAELEEEQGRP